MAKSQYPDWVLKHKRKGTELRNIRGRYYLYEVSSKWDKEKKRPKKITGKCLGSITEEGFKPSRKSTADSIEDNTISIKTYASYLLFKQLSDNWIGKLREEFPDTWKQLYSMAYTRLFYHSPIKRMNHYFDNSFFSEEFKNMPFSTKTISKILHQTGNKIQSIDNFLKHFIDNEHIALIDATSIFTKSKNMYEARLGYNNKRQWDPQFNLLYLYDHVLALPLYYRLVQGDLREISAMKLTLESSGIKNAIIIGDKGFSSQENEQIMKERELDYIMPLRRNSSYIDYNVFTTGSKKAFDGHFSFNKRHIWYKVSKQKEKTIILYLDEILRISEEKDYLDRLEKQDEDYSEEVFFERNHRMGTLALCTNIDNKSPEEIFQIYKSRNEVEQLFDVFKNTLQADRTYMHSIESLRGWLFINHLAIITYYRIYKLLKDKGILNKISVNDIIAHTTHINKLKINDKWILQEIPKKTEKILNKCDLNFHIT